MAEEKKDETKGSCACGAGRCGGCKFLAGVLVGLLLAGAGLGVFMAGHCSGHARGACPMASAPASK